MKVIIIGNKYTSYVPYGPIIILKNARGKKSWPMKQKTLEKTKKKNARGKKKVDPWNTHYTLKKRYISSINLGNEIFINW